MSEKMVWGKFLPFHILQRILAFSGITIALWALFILFMTPEVPPILRIHCDYTVLLRALFSYSFDSKLIFSLGKLVSFLGILCLGLGIFFLSSLTLLLLNYAELLTIRKMFPLNHSKSEKLPLILKIINIIDYFIIFVSLCNFLLLSLILTEIKLLHFINLAIKLHPKKFIFAFIGGLVALVLYTYIHCPCVKGESCSLKYDYLYGLHPLWRFSLPPNEIAKQKTIMARRRRMLSLLDITDFYIVFTLVFIAVFILYEVRISSPRPEVLKFYSYSLVLLLVVSFFISNMCSSIERKIDIENMRLGHDFSGNCDDLLFPEFSETCFTGLWFLVSSGFFYLALAFPNLFNYFFYYIPVKFRLVPLLISTLISACLAYVVFNSKVKVNLKGESQSDKEKENIPPET
jgi:hypothetical protein